MATYEQALQLVQLLEAELMQRERDIRVHNAFYRGDHPLKFASDEFAKFHGDRYRDFSDNWTQVVADSPVERMTVTGFQASGQTDADEELWKVWQVNGLDADSQLGFLGSVTNARSFVLVWGDPSDPDMPVVTFEDPSQCVIAMQNAINLLWAQLFTASDYASFPQRVIMGAERPVIPKLNSEGIVVGTQPVDIEKFAVDRVMMFNGKDVRIGEWQAANLTMYTGMIEVAVGHLAAQTRTPQHYLIGKMANLAEGALLAAETGLVKRVEEKQTWSGQGLREMARLIALARGEDDKAQALRSGRVLWKDAESRSHAQLADALLKLKQLGFPFKWLALKYGLTPTEVADVMALRMEELEADPVTELTRQLGGVPGPGGGPPPEGDEPDEGEEPVA